MNKKNKQQKIIMHALKYDYTLKALVPAVFNVWGVCLCLYRLLL